MRIRKSRRAARCAAALLAITVSLGFGTGTARSAVFEDNFDSESSGTGALNYSAFAKWTVTKGSVDLIGNGFVDVFPGHGLYIDLDGSTGVGGTLQSMELTLVPGRYRLSFDLSGNAFNDAEEAVVVRLGSLFSESFTLARNEPFTAFSREIQVDAPVKVSITFEDRGVDGDNGGMKLDTVSLKDLAEGSGPVAWWRAEGDATDSANDHDGQLVAGVNFVEGICGQAFDFTGPGYVEVPESPDIDFGPGDPHSIVFWAYRTGGPETYHFIGKREGCGGGLNFVQVAGVEIFPVPFNQWVFVALVADGIGYYQLELGAGDPLRVDGTNTAPTAQNDAPWRIGTSGECGAFFGQDFTGYLDEVMIFDRALTGPELDAMFEAACRPIANPFLFERADCNADGVVDISDPVCTLSWLFLGTEDPACIAALNVDAGADVDISDAIYLLSFLFLGGPPPAMPFGSCGVSAAIDEALGCAFPPAACR